MSVDATRLAGVISPLRRGLLAVTREREGLPDIPDAQIEVLRALPRGVVGSPSGLATTLGVGRSTISNLLVSMESAGLVTRRTRPEDRRHIDVVASDRALGYVERFDRASALVIAEALASAPAADLAMLDAVLPALERLRDVLLDSRNTTQEGQR